MIRKRSFIAVRHIYSTESTHAHYAERLQQLLTAELETVPLCVGVPLAAAAVRLRSCPTGPHRSLLPISKIAFANNFAEF